MSGLIVPTKPDNLMNYPGVEVTSDLYNICERIKKEVSPRLKVVINERDPDNPWVVLELCEDGVERFVGRYPTLDGRVLERLKRMLHIPLEHRMAALEKEVEQHNKDLHVDEEAEARAIDRLWRALKEDGYVSDGGKYPITKHRRLNGV